MSSVLGYRIPSDYKNAVSKYTHRWRHPAFLTMHPGLAYVTYHRHLNDGERLRGPVSQLVQSQPMLGPLMQGFRMITIATFTPDAVLYGWMRNGIRYSYDEWKMFDKWTFSPYSYDGDGASMTAYAYDAIDPSVAASGVSGVYNAYYLHPGLAAVNYEEATPSTKTFYNIWRTSYFVNSDSTEVTELGFSWNYHCVVGRGGLYDCFGIAPGSVVPVVGQDINHIFAESWRFSLAPFVSYFLSCYYYLANMQEDYMYFSRGAYSLTAIEGPVKGSPRRLTNLGFHEALCGFNPKDFIVAISKLHNLTQTGNASSMDVFENLSLDRSFMAWLYMGSQAHGGLFSVPYRPDFFNNIIKVGQSPTISVPVQQVDGDGGTYQLAIPDLRYYNKWQNIADRVFVGQGRFGDQLRTLFGTNSNPYTNKPDFLGIWQASINPVNTVAMAAGENSQQESSTPGQMVSRLDSYTDFNNKSVDYYAKEPGTVMCISFLVPMPAYSQGLHPDMAVTSFADEWNPELAGLGFTSVPRWRYSMLPKSFISSSPFVSGDKDPVAIDPNMEVVGDTVAFDWLKTDYPRLHGEFATGGYFEYWTLDRRFTDYWENLTPLGVVDNISAGEYFGTYINPLAWQYIFQAQSLLDPNFFAGFNFDFKVTSSVPAGYMPYMGR